MTWRYRTIDCVRRWFWVAHPGKAEIVRTLDAIRAEPGKNEATARAEELASLTVEADRRIPKENRLRPYLEEALQKLVTAAATVDVMQKAYAPDAKVAFFGADPSASAGATPEDYAKALEGVILILAKAWQKADFEGP